MASTIMTSLVSPFSATAKSDCEAPKDTGAAAADVLGSDTFSGDRESDEEADAGGGLMSGDESAPVFGAGVAAALPNAV